VSILHGDCLAVMAEMPKNSVDLIVADPPYFRVKDEPWDRQWAKPEGFLAWIGEVAAQWHRILKPNGSLYCFASPQMGARVEVKLREQFDVLNSITWAKPDPHSTLNYGAGNGGRISKESLRSYYPNTERIIFAEHYGADNIAKGEAGYVAKCDELRGFVFEPLRAYLDGERARAGFDRKACDDACGNQMAGHYFSRIQWRLPPRANYEKLREAFNARGGEYLRREYDDLRREYDDLRREYEDLRREYDDLRREYEDLRRPFAVTADVPYTDVWTFPTVGTYKGKHPCEKPQAMLRHIIAASSRPNAVVLDSFAGSGSTGEAALALGRQFIGIEISEHWVQKSQERIALRADLFTEAL
jgi:site-specific DNA-methyltransferase (adenine-specific)